MPVFNIGSQYLYEKFGYECELENKGGIIYKIICI